MATMKMPMAVGTGSVSSTHDLLWTNPTMTEGATFAAQTINENSTGWVSGKQVSDYDGFIIAAQHTTSDFSARKQSLSYIPKVAPTELERYVSDIFATDRASSSGATVRIREVTIDSSGINIGAAGGGNANVYPLYIWGVKGTLE